MRDLSRLEATRLSSQAVDKPIMFGFLNMDLKTFFSILASLNTPRSTKSSPHHLGTSWLKKKILKPWLNLGQLIKKT